MKRSPIYVPDTHQTIVLTKGENAVYIGDLQSRADITPGDGDIHISRSTGFTCIAAVGGMEVSWVTVRPTVVQDLSYWMFRRHRTLYATINWNNRDDWDYWGNT